MSLLFTKSFKGYEDRTAELDKAVNQWMVTNQGAIQEVVDVKAVLSHEHQSRANSGDLILIVLYRAESPLD